MGRKSHCFQRFARMRLKTLGPVSFRLGEMFFSFSQYLQLSCQRLHLHLWALSVHFPVSIHSLPGDGMLEFSFSTSHVVGAHANEF